MINDRFKLAGDLFDVYILIYKELKEINKNIMTELEYSKPHMEVMKYLREHGDSKMSDIGKELFVTKSYITALVDKLEEKEFVYRKQSKNDRRIILISLTEKGEEVFANFKKKFNEVIYEKMKHITDIELDDLAEAIKLIKKIEGSKLFEKNSKGDK